MLDRFLTGRGFVIAGVLCGVASIIASSNSPHPRDLQASQSLALIAAAFIVGAALLARRP